MTDFEIGPEKIIKDIQECVREIQTDAADRGQPITDDCNALLRLCVRLEYLLQFARKDKSKLATSIDYWKFFCSCLADVKGIRDGLKFIKAHQDVKTPAGRARAFVRYCLVHHFLGDALQHCFSNEKMVKKFFSPHSILLQQQFWSQILESLYHLNEVEMDLDPLGPELDISWPSFSKKPPDSRNFWMPSRSLSSSMTSLVSRVSLSSDSIISVQEDLRSEADRLSLFQQETERKELEYLDVIKSLEQEVMIIREKYEKDTSLLQKDCVDLQKRIRELEEESKPPETCEAIIQTEAAPSRINHLLIENNQKIAQLESQLAAVTKERDQLTSDKMSLSLKVEVLYKEVEASKTSLAALKEQAEYSLGKFQAKSDSTKEIMKALECENRRMKLFKADALEEISSLKNKLEECEKKSSEPLPQTNGILPAAAEDKPGDVEHVCNSKDLSHLLKQQSSLLCKLEKKFSKSLDENSKLKCQSDLLADMLRIPTDPLLTNGEVRLPNFKNPPPESSLPDDANLADKFAHNNSRLESMLEGLRQLLRELSASCHLHRQVMDRVKEQEKHLFGVTQELEATQSLVHTLKDEHSKLRSAGLILKDELKEKRKLLMRLKKQLEATRVDSHRVRTMNTENQTEWQSLRDEIDKRRAPQVPSTSATEEPSPPKSKSDRLEYLEEQCKLLYLSLVQSSQRSSQLDQRLGQLMGGGSSSEEATPTPPEPTVPIDEDIPQVEDIEEVEEEEEEVQPPEEEEEPSVSSSPSSPTTPEEEEEEGEEEEGISAVELRRKATRQFVDKIKQERRQSTAMEAELRAQVDELLKANEDLGKQVVQLVEQKNAISRRESEYRKRVEFIFKQERENSTLLQAKLRSEQDRLEFLVTEMKEELDNKVQQLEDLRSFATQAQDAASKSQESIEHLKEELNTEKELRNTEEELFTSQEHGMRDLETKMREQEQLFISLTDSLEDIKSERTKEQVQHVHETTLELDQEREHAAILNQDIRQRQVAMMEMDQELNQLRADSLQLKRKVIQLIKEKDLLWQRTDRLSYLQRVQASDRWMEDQQVQSCTECRTGFTFLLRKHHCRVCGRIFCYKCADHWVFISSCRNRSRVCNECFTTQAEIKADVEKASSSLLVNIQEASEEVETALDGDAAASRTPTIFGMLAPARLSTTPPMIDQDPISSNHSPEDGAKPIKEDEEFSVISDEEIVKSLSSSSPYNNNDWKNEGTSEEVTSNSLATVTCEELWAGPIHGQMWVAPNSSCSLPVLCRELSVSGNTFLVWEITTEPKGITLRITCDSEVLVPDHHFVSDEHTLEGRLPLIKTGTYTLVFANSLSMVMVRNVKYKLKLEEELVKSPDNLKE